MAKREHDTLDISRLEPVLCFLKSMPKEKWQDLGLKLGLLQPTLDTIETNHKQDVERCLKECLSKWLRRVDKVDEYGLPTLSRLADALEEIDRATAERIRSDTSHCDKLESADSAIAPIKDYKISKDICKAGGSEEKVFCEMKTFRMVLNDIQLDKKECNGKLVLLLIGRTGQGKSALINSISESLELKAKEQSQLQTNNSLSIPLQSYTYPDVIPGITITLIDTPGLQDTQGREQNYNYIQSIKENYPEVNLVLYCMDMTSKRIHMDDVEAIRKLDQAFAGSKFWEKVVTVFTFANNERYDQITDRDKIILNQLCSDISEEVKMKKIFENRLKLRIDETKIFLLEKVGFSEALVAKIPFIPAGYYEKDRLTPDPRNLHGTTENWLYDLLKKCCEKMKLNDFSKLSLSDKIHLAILIDNNKENESNGLVNEQGKATKEALQQLGFFVLYFNSLTSHCILQLLEALQHIDHSQLAMFALVVLSKGKTPHVYGSDNEIVPFEKIVFETSKEIFQVYFFHLLNNSSSESENKLGNCLKDSDIPKNSIAFATFFPATTSPALDSFLKNLSHCECQPVSPLTKCFEQIKSDCLKFSEECLYINHLDDDFVLPIPNEQFDDKEKARYVEMKLNIFHMMSYHICCQTIDILMKNRERLVAVINENFVQLSATAASIAVAAAGSVLFLYRFDNALPLSLFGGIVSCICGLAADHTSQGKIGMSLNAAQEHLRLYQQFRLEPDDLAVQCVENEQNSTDKIVITNEVICLGSLCVTLTISKIKEYHTIAKLLALTIPANIGLLFHKIKQVKSRENNADSFITQLLEYSLKGLFSIINKWKFDVDDDSKCDGYFIQVPSTIKNQSTITVSTILSGPFRLPPGTILVSAIYDVKIDNEVKEPITMEIDHCVDEPDLSKMTFAIGTANIAEKFFEFNTLKDGDFHDDKGSIKLKESCLLCILYHDTKSFQIKYVAQCSYTKAKGFKDFWKMKCTFSKYLSAHIQFARQNSDTEIYPFKFSVPSAPYMSLDEFKHERKIAEKWSLYPRYIPDKISKDELDVLEINNAEKLLNQIIPSMELDIIRTDEATNDKLRYEAHVQGSTLRLVIAAESQT